MARIYRQQSGLKSDRGSSETSWSLGWLVLLGARWGANQLEGLRSGAAVAKPRFERTSQRKHLDQYYFLELVLTVY
ncbi:Hypothetical predicted protein [Marmota monax]|uniref:Uncharacterized protein n=1 Tax=Marmota monax TaxID=9995 RepID=A0A5E4BAV2_MARMO|nr:Hypothetical predicted protein [Marmota monax]